MSLHSCEGGGEDVRPPEAHVLAKAEYVKEARQVNVLNLPSWFHWWAKWSTHSL